MKLLKNSLLACLITMSWLSCGALFAQSFSVKGQVKNATEGIDIEVSTWPIGNSEVQKLGKTTTKKSGKFGFEGLKSDSPYLLLSYKNIKAVIINDGKSDIELNIDDATNPPALSGKGGSDQNKWLRFREQRTQLNQMYTSSIGKEFQLLMTQKKSEQDKNSGNADALKAVNAKYDSLEKSLSMRYMEAAAKEESALFKEIEEANSAAVTYLASMSWQESYWLAIGAGLVQKLTEKEGKNAYTDALNAVLASHKALQVGMVAPELNLTDADGKNFKLSDFRGQYVLVDFWASWCGPCRAENPNVVANFQKYKDKGFTILGISLDSDRSKWLQAIEKDQLTWPHASDLKGWASAAGKVYNITSIPANVLLDKEGKIIAKNLREAKLGDQLADIFK